MGPSWRLSRIRLAESLPPSPQLKLAVITGSIRWFQHLIIQFTISLAWCSASCSICLDMDHGHASPRSAYLCVVFSVIIRQAFSLIISTQNDCSKGAVWVKSWYSLTPKLVLYLYCVSFPASWSRLLQAWMQLQCCNRYICTVPSYHIHSGCD
jgi:hypothetical protein